MSFPPGSDPNSPSVPSTRFNNFQRNHRVELPTPPTPSVKKGKRIANIRKDRLKKKAFNAEQYRQLCTYGFTVAKPNTLKSENDININSKAHLNINANSTSSNYAVQEQAKALSAEISKCLSSAATDRDKFKSAVNNIVQMSKEQSQLPAPLEK